MQDRWPFLMGLIAGLAAVWLGLHTGTETVEGWRLAARWTARIGFPIFILTYSASSLGRLWPSDLTRGLWRGRRWWGLGFFASHTVHLIALVTFLNLSGESRPLPVLIGGGFGYVLLFAMAATSNNAAMRALGHNWKRLHSFGIHYLWFIFAFSYLGRIMKPESMMAGTIGITVALAALGLRIAAWLKGRSQAALAA